MTRVGFLGCAHVHAVTYRDELAAMPSRAQVVAVYDHDQDRARAFASATGLRVAASAQELCSLVDAVIVTSEHVHYPELVLAAASAGRPVLCEKPLGTTAEAADTILQSDAWLSVALPVRYAHAIREARDLVLTGTLGDLLAVSGVNHAPFPGGFFGRAALSGGGALIDHVVHLADAVRWVTGAEFASVYAEANEALGVGDVEDVAQVTARTTAGAWVSIDPSWARPTGMAGGNDFLMEMWFENGRISVDAFARHGTFVSAGGAVEHLSYGTGIDTALLVDWLAAIVAGGEPPIPALDAWRATEVALAALESARTRSVIDLSHSEGA